MRSQQAQAEPMNLVAGGVILLAETHQTGKLGLDHADAVALRQLLALGQRYGAAAMWTR